MRLDGIGLVEKPKIIKICQAIDAQELDNVYAALRGADENLRQAFIKFLALNNPIGADLALKKLTEITDPASAVRAAAVCLFVIVVAGQSG